jgi:very-short-patch-repair endonuclease
MIVDLGKEWNVSDDLGSKVLEYLRLRGPAKAKDIAIALGLERSTINQLLHGSLRAKVRQDKTYAWSPVAGAPPAAASRPPAETRPNNYQPLFSYYLDCLTQDDDSGVSVFAESRYDLDYVELETWPFETTPSGGESEALRRLIARQKRDSRKKTLWLGYPTLVRHARSRSGWQGAMVEPLLLWPLDTEGTNFAFVPEPIVNTRALRNAGNPDNLLGEAAQLAEELGLDGGDLPPLDELTARLRDLRPEWPWKETLAPVPLRKPGELRQLAEPGIYNAAVVVMVDRSPFTQGLERDLGDLGKVAESSIMNSSLGALLGKGSPRERDDTLLLEPAPLNAEQRSAVRDALTKPLTVITGPPGTGKSQVVSAILVNAAWRGMRVLFSSKNNKAVDVVLDRVNGLAPMPTVLRLGPRALQEQLAQHLSSILSFRPTADDRRAYEQTVLRLKRRGEALTAKLRAYEQLVSLRNRVDRLEQAAEETRQILGPTHFAEPSAMLGSDLAERLGALAEATGRAKREEAPLLDRMLWPIIKRGRQREATEATAALLKALSHLGVQPHEGADLAQEQAKALLAAVRIAADYRSGLAELAKAGDVGALADEIARETEAVAADSLDAWRGWSALLPDRLDETDRAALGDYAALLRLIAKADEQGGTVDRKLWRRFYELAGKTAKALPCWAVTSLSARGRIPLSASEFDLVVIDEASQCDIASAIPLLYRAKRAVIIGDPQQLRHITRLSQQREQALMVKHDVLSNPGASWSYRANALYDLAAAKVPSNSIVALRDHHRSHESIIRFSNEFFYGGRLRVATDYRRLKRPNGPAVRWIDVKGRTVRPLAGGAVNHEEAAAVVSELRRLALEQRFSGEMGVVTPFRAQANLIEELIARDDALSGVLASRNFISETAHRFQGDERDLILFSPTVSSGTPESATGFLKSQGNIFNVGITRARGALIVVGDAAACMASEVEYLSAFAKYVAEQNQPMKPAARPRSEHEAGEAYPQVARPELVSPWETVLFAALVRAGLRPVPQYDVDSFILDFALIRENGRRLNIEVDGEHYHRDWDGELIRRDQLRNLRMIEMGWDVMRFWVYQVRDDLPGCVAKVAQWAAKADAMPNQTE